MGTILKYNIGQEVTVFKNCITKDMKGVIIENDSTDKDYKLKFGTSFQGYYMQDEIGVNGYDYDLLAFDTTFNKFIKGQVVQSMTSMYGMSYDIPHDKRYEGQGIIFENGYKVYQYGGGCSGEDYNTAYIVDPNGKLLASETH